MTRAGWIGAGIAAAGIATTAAVLYGQHRAHERAANTPDALADLIMGRQDRDGTPGVHLTGPVTTDDERFFPNPFDTETTRPYFGSYVEVLAAADHVGNRDSVATRDEVAGLLALGDLDHSGVLEQREQQNISSIAGYTSSDSEFFPTVPTIADVPKYNHLVTDTEALTTGAEFAVDQAPAFVDQLREPWMHQ